VDTWLFQRPGQFPHITTITRNYKAHPLGGTLDNSHLNILKSTSWRIPRYAVFPVNFLPIEGVKGVLVPMEGVKSVGSLTWFTH
ncbi:hypothetical protein KI387_036034, partial [Taxus chinensis]